MVACYSDCLNFHNLVLHECFNLFVYVFGCVSEFLIQHLVRSSETEALHTEYLSVCADKTFKCDRQTSRHTEYLGSSRKYAFLILLALAAEQAFARYAYDADFHAVLAQ